MLNFRVCLSTLVILCFTLQPFNVISMSGEPLMTDACGKTPDPSRCMKCLRSDPKSQTADFRGFAMILIRCGKTNAYEVYGTMYDILTKTTDITLKNLVSDCYNHFDEAGYYIVEAGSLLQSKGIDAAKQAVNGSVDSAMTAVKYCVDLFRRNSGVSVPTGLIRGVNEVGIDCEIIMGILNRNLIR